MFYFIFFFFWRKNELTIFVRIIDVKYCGKNNIMIISQLSFIYIYICSISAGRVPCDFILTVFPIEKQFRKRKFKMYCNITYT